jgi:hypothetical protein
LQSEDSSRRIIPVEGFSILASQLISGADLAVSWGRTILECFWQLELGYLLLLELLLYQVLLVL